MDFLLTIFVCLLLLVILYLVLNYKIIHLIEQIFKKYYQNQLKTDIQDFYRELESYAIIFENRVQRFKSLIERQEKQVTEWKNTLSNIKTTKKAKEILSTVNEMFENNTINEAKINVEEHLKNNIMRHKVTEQKNKIKENFAEEVLSDMPSHIYQQEKTESNNILETHKKFKTQKYYTSDKNNAEQMTSKSKVTKFLSNLGKPLSKSLLKTTINNKINLSQNLQNDLNQRSSMQTKDNYENKQTKPDLKLIIHEKQLVFQKNKQKTLNEEEVTHLIRDLSDTKKRPMALQVLTRGGFSISDISEMSEISNSELEATRNIYGG